MNQKKKNILLAINELQKLNNLFMNNESWIF